MIGKIEYIAKTGGMKIEELGDKWINPIPGLKNLVINNFQKGDVIDYTLGENDYLVDIKKADSQPKVEEIKMNQSTPKHDLKTLDIHRQVAIKTAFGFFQVAAHTPLELADQIAKYCFILADKIEEHLNK